MARNFVKFNEKKATQAFALLLTYSAGKADFLKTIKLLYMADRTALQEWGRTISTDWYAAMAKGPVLSHVYNLIKSEIETDSDWFRYMKLRRTNKTLTIELKTMFIDTDELSEAEIDVLRKIWLEFGHYEKRDLIAHTHTFPEWKEANKHRGPGTNSYPIEWTHILACSGKSVEEIEDIKNELDYYNRVA